MDSGIRKELIDLGRVFEGKEAQEVLHYAVERFGDKVSLASSFGPEDMVLMDMLSKVSPGAKVFLLDTGYLFPETLELIERSKEKYALSFEIYQGLQSVEEMEKEFGKNLHQIDSESCCRIRKIEPLKRALSLLDAWVTGIRRDQAPTRANAKKVEYDDNFKLVKFNPLVDWTIEQVWDYIRKEEVPYNPLHDKNYPSIGCFPCTNPVKEGEDPRSGRWAGKEKTECGLHINADGEIVPRGN